MLEEIKNIKTGKKDLRNFGVIIGMILLIIAGFLFFKERESFRVFLYTAVAFISFGLIIPIVLNPLYLPWMVFAVILGWFMTRIILSILFYLVITPIGFISRVFGKQFLELRWDKSKGSYWNYRTNEHLQNENYEKQF